ncbi:MAG: hypothetical protein JST31_02760 [Actinobacteria bacterium]|nr:hypothetical protein [Actinomycetota bacterium]
MNDEWRLEIDPHETRHGHALVERLEATELEHDLSRDFSDRVIVSRDEARVYLYGGSREQLDRAREVVLRLAQEHGWNVTAEIRRWHAVAEEWEDSDQPLPRSDEEEEAERVELMRTEDREAEERGYPEYEVRVDLGSRHEAVKFAERLREEGLPNVHRWRFVLVGAADEDAANALAERIRAEAPADGRVKVEGVWALAWKERPPNPFAFMGGLADS